MTNYGDSTDLGYLLTNIGDSVSSSLKSLALDTADVWVLTKVPSVPTSVPTKVEKAATYYAYVFILRNLYDTAEADSMSAQWYEQLAEDLLASYASEVPDEMMSPYKASLTPTNRYMRRDKLTVEDDRDYENVDNVTWESE
jgi:hypothetical protein